MEIPIPLQKEIEEYITNHQPQLDWDYREELSGEQIAKLIKSPEDAMAEIEEELFEQNEDHCAELEKQTRKDILLHFRDKLKAAAGGKKWKKDAKEFIRECVSIDLNIEGLMRNTPAQVFFYDTGMETEGETWAFSPAERRLAKYRIKKTLSIPDSRFDKNIYEMIDNASYGGRLVVYFNMDIDDLLELMAKNANRITFSNAAIAIIDNANGSGHDTELPKFTFSLPLKRENIFYEKAIHYNYTFSVCGMSSDWCDSTDVQTSFDPALESVQIPVSPLNAAIDQQKQYDLTYRSGKCTFGDMDITRHRNIIYINDFPCGNKCTDCHTFWID